MCYNVRVFSCGTQLVRYHSEPWIGVAPCNILTERLLIPVFLTFLKFMTHFNKHRNITLNV